MNDPRKSRPPMPEPSPSFDLPPSLARVIHRMCCPGCRAELKEGDEALVCQGCETRFPIRKGIPLLAIRGSWETWTQEEEEIRPEGFDTLPDERPERPASLLTDAGAPSSAGYQTWYQDLEEAREYNEAYRSRPTKRWSTRREHALLEKLLSGQPRSELLLDLPSGGGRLSPQLSRHTELLVEADIGFGQLLYGRQEHRGEDERLWLTASAFHIPFQDQSVDGVVCCRLSHHLPTQEERDRLVAELLRVARRFVIMTYFDFHSVKNYLRRARRPFNKKPPKMTMTTDRVAELAREHGAQLVAQPSLSRLFSGHRYALMVRK